jgi:hypothetical protein
VFFPLDPGGKNEEKDNELIIRVDHGKVTIIRLGKNDCQGQNTLAYFCLKELDKEKSFATLSPYQCGFLCRENKGTMV